MAAKILILEDDESLRESLLETLEDFGYQVEGAGAAREALAMVGRTGYDLVISDVRMAGMDGLEFLASLRELRPESRSIVITGYADEDAPARALKARAEDYLYKPVTAEALVQSVERVLGSTGEAQRYEGLLGTLVSGYRRLLEKAATAVAAAELGALDRDRDQVFAHLFVGIRSGMLSQRTALSFYDRLEQLESSRERLKEAGVPRPGRLELSRDYRYLAELLQGSARSGMESHNPNRRADQVSPARFGHLFRAVKEGLLSTEQLKMAPFLRQLDPGLVRQSAQLEGLFREVWGQ